MKTSNYKTNINCTGCLSKVSPVLNSKKEIEEWEVDLSSSQKILTIKSNTMEEKDLINAITDIGFQIEKLE